MPKDKQMDPMLSQKKHMLSDDHSHLSPGGVYGWLTVITLLIVAGFTVTFYVLQENRSFENELASMVMQDNGVTQRKSLRGMMEKKETQVEQMQDQMKQVKGWNTFQVYGLTIPYPSNWHSAMQTFGAGGVNDLQLDTQVMSLIAINSTLIVFPAYHEIAYPWDITIGVADSESDDLLTAAREAYDSFEESEERVGDLTLHRLEGIKTVLGEESRIVTYVIFSSVDGTDRSFYLTTYHRADRGEDDYTQAEHIDLADKLVEQLKLHNVSESELTP